MSWSLVIPLAGALLANVPEALPPAAPAPEAPPASLRVAAQAAPPETHWYGGVSLAVDGLNVAATTMFIVEDAQIQVHHPSLRAELRDAVLGIYLLDGPIVHLAHGRPGRAAESLLLRAAGFAAGVVLALAISEGAGCNTENFPHSSFCDVPAYAIVVAPVTAMLVDDLVLSREPVVEQRPVKSVNPHLVVQPGLALFGIGGSF
ncbi:MAG TPA: hypothetical protein VHG72_19220 [Polyangia bacterium]|nr:hypothetical protein [Polyangia bacterium]HVZ89109.1 hypothetical protein [Polyangia bacterium]